jgi:tetratricopeptide (TPR) repeat protein
MQALSDFDKVVKLDSTSSLAYFNRAIVRTQIGDYNKALEDYNRVAIYSPNVLLYYNRASLYARIGDLDKAIDDYTKAIGLYPDFANAYLNRSRLRMMIGDMKGAQKDHQTANEKIAEYKSRLNDSTATPSIYADTTHKFDKLLSFDANASGSKFEQIADNATATDVGMKLIPLFKFTITQRDSATMARSNIYHVQRMEDFKQKVGNEQLFISCNPSSIAADSLAAIDRNLAQRMLKEENNWVLLFERSVTQSLIKQYTNAVNTLSSAIMVNPTNPFLYLNRSTTRAEMIDFISSIDNTYQRISIDSDPANRLRNSGVRQYSYDEAIADIDMAIKLFPDFAYSYYNRANLLAISGQLPDAYDDYTRAIELNPNFGEAYYNRGLVQIFMRDTHKGCLDLSKAGELSIEEAYETLKHYTIDK